MFANAAREHGAEWTPPAIVKEKCALRYLCGQERLCRTMDLLNALLEPCSIWEQRTTTWTAHAGGRALAPFLGHVDNKGVAMVSTKPDDIFFDIFVQRGVAKTCSPRLVAIKMRLVSYGANHPAFATWLKLVQHHWAHTFLDGNLRMITSPHAILVVSEVAELGIKGWRLRNSLFPQNFLALLLEQWTMLSRWAVTLMCQHVG